MDGRSAASSVPDSASSSDEPVSSVPSEPPSSSLPVPDGNDSPILVVSPREASGPDDTAESYQQYRYQKFVLDRAGAENAVFSSESFLTSLDIWREMVKDPAKSSLKQYISRDYISFISTPSLHILNRVWIDDSLSVPDGSLERISGLFFPLDMDAPSAPSVKNAWLSENTNGYLSYFPSSSSVMDITSERTFSDAWETAKTYDTKSRIFYNKDGTESRTVMFCDTGSSYWDLGCADAYAMYFANGFYLMVILPHDGADPADIPVARLMAGQAAPKKSDVRLFLPAFSVESSYQLTCSDFSLPVGSVSETVIQGFPASYEPVFSQTSRFSVSCSGAGETAVQPASVSDDFDGHVILCDRPFLYYLGDPVNEDVVFFGVVNRLTSDMCVTEEDAGLTDSAASVAG